MKPTCVQPARRLALLCLASTLLTGVLAPARASEPPSFVIPAWAFDRGNVRVFTEEYADAAPMVAFGGQSPVNVEYDLDLPVAGRYTLRLEYAAGAPRPIEFLVDGNRVGEAARTASGSWNTSGAHQETVAELDLAAGPHTFRFRRERDFPHVVSLRFESPALPPDFAPHRPKARPLPAITPAAQLKPFRAEVNPAALRLAIQDLTARFGSRYPRGAEFSDRLDRIERELEVAETRAQARTALEQLARDALLANPLLDFDRLLVLKRGFPKPPAARQAQGQALGVGSLNAHTSDDTPRQGHWQDELAVLSNLRGEPRFTTVHRPANDETVIDPALHFEAQRLLFAQNGAQQKNWRLWEIGVDGSHLRQVTPDDGEDVAHFDPCYLPDGRIIFASTAVYQGLPCEFGAQAMTCLYLLDPRAQTVRQLTFEQDSDWCPTLLPNGRVMYLRWEYTDQSHANSRILFHMNPDGTDQRELRGSGSWFPGSFYYARPVPGHPHQLLGIASGHHGTPRSGRLLLLDPNIGRREGEGIVQEIPRRGQPVEPIVRDRLVDGVWPQFLMPWPLSPEYHLVSAKLGPNSLWGVYLVDVFDNVTLLHELEANALLWPIPLQPVTPPPVIPDRVRLASDQATVFITDLYSGPGLEGVPRGIVKSLRLIEYYFSRRGFGGLYGTLGQDGPWDVKRILGTVPVEADGSAHFVIPANTALSLQPLDEQGQALQLMRSWFVGMPGEAVSCGGCHEPQNEVSPNRPSLAARRPPTPIEPWYGPARGFSFVREVQPVLDHHCVRCHDGAPETHQTPTAQAMAGQTAQPPYLKGDVWPNDWSSQLAGRWDGGGKFTRSYFDLARYVRRPGIEGDRRMFTPLDYHFRTTALGQLLSKGHHDVHLDVEAWERLATWFDLNAPFYGTWGEIPQFSQGYGSLDHARLARVHARAMELRRQYVPMGPHPDYEEIPDAPAYTARDHGPRTADHGLRTSNVQLRTSNFELRPSNFDLRPSTFALPDDVWPFDTSTALAKQRAAALDGRLTRSLDLGDGVTLELIRVPGGTFPMGSTTGHPDEAPQTSVTVPPFWMARCETANRQFKQFRPEHESRTEDRHGYQFGVVGYDQDQPDQPAVRVSWQDAVAFCQWLADRTGLPINLPSEAQWEWACRAGTATPFWFGDLAADYSTFANLGDQRLRDFAADTALDNYTAARPMVNPNRYDDWIPRDDRYNDGGFVTEPVGSYRPNPWGLHDLHGNAWEWTRSPYRPYPYTDAPAAADIAERVVRGGSWYDRPQRCTSSFRLSYPSWQRVYNVGFRIVCEDLPTSLANPGTIRTARR
jgi:formylglycine-generating enzyme required for sulfatase activity